MTSRRLILITRRYWPLVGGAERAMAGLAQSFHLMGHNVHVLTAKWESQWPTEIVHRDVKVVRLPNPKTRAWGTFRYMSNLKRWLKTHRDEFDAVLVSMLKHDAHVAIKTLGQLGKPTIVRAEGSGTTGDCAFHKTARFGTRMKNTCMKSSAIIAPSEKVESELLESGFARDLVHLIPNGVEIPAETDADCQKRARKSLADTHPILAVDPGEPLVIYTGRLDKEKGLLDLVKAWQEVAKTFPNARLWLVGEGADGQEIWNRVRELNLNYQIVLPGSFDDVGDLLAAADAFVLPSYQEGMSLSLLEAMAAAVPVVASDIPGNSGLISSERGFLFPPGNVAELAKSILEALQKQRIAKKYATNARNFVAANYSLDRMALDHFRIIESSILTSGN